MNAETSNVEPRTPNAELFEIDAAIGRIVGVAPRITYVVSNNGGKSFFLTSRSEREAREWLDDTLGSYPEGILKGSKVVPVENWPRYSSDLNAMHEAEKVLQKAARNYITYCQKLSVMCGGDWDALFATATQRAVAFLLTFDVQRSEFDVRRLPPLSTPETSNVELPESLKP